MENIILNGIDYKAQPLEKSLTLNPEMLRIKIQGVNDKVSDTIAILNQLQNKIARGVK